MIKTKLSLCAALLLLLAAGILPHPATSLAQAGGSQTFPQTGKTVSGDFLTYWNAHGGTTLLGLPVSDAMQDVSPTDGKTYTMQYFERAVLEMHPEYAGTPFAVEGSLIGSFFYHERYPLGGPNQQADSSNPAKFTQTGMTLGGRFLQYWQQNGGVSQFGYPISNEFQEKNQLDGKTYTVQYFERAVLEMHPENAAPNDVELSQLGKFQFDAATSLTFTDSTGTKVTLTKRPQRVVCLFSLCEDILYTLGVDPAAVSDTFGARPDFWGSHASTFGKVSGGFAAPNLEDIAAAKPDLVIGFLPHVGLRDSLKNIAPLYIMNPALYQDSINYELEMGYLLGRPYQARLAVEAFGHKLQSYKAKATNDQLPLILFGNNVNFAIMTSGSLFGSVLAAVTNYPWAPPGPGDVLSPDQEPGTIQYSLEKVLEKDPDVLLIETRGGGTPLSQQLAADPIWSQLKAVQNKRAYDVDFNLYVGGRGMRSLSLALDDAMTKIYPSVFPQPLP